MLVERSPDMVVALLAIWKAGFAYVPLDPTPSAGPAQLHPLQRRRFGRGHWRLLRGAAHFRRRGGCRSGEGAMGHRGQASGAAGRERESGGVCLPDLHVGIDRGSERAWRSPIAPWSICCPASRDRPGVGRTDTLLAITTIAFDIAALELFAPLLVGGTVAIARREDVSDGSRLLAALDRSEATILQATPASWRLLLEAGFRSRPGFKMLCGGEALPRELADQLLDGGGALWNMYGPTETTVWSSCGEVAGWKRSDHHWSAHRQHAAACSRPLRPASAIRRAWSAPYRRRRRRQGVFPAGRIDRREIHPRPVQVKRRGCTALAMFARRLPSGEIQVLGRADTQIKLRGFRIELEEIEAVLSRSVGAAAVALREDIAGQADAGGLSGGDFGARAVG